MLKKKPQKNNLKLAGIFISAVLGLILLSFIVKLFLIVQDSKFDGKHKFNVLLENRSESYIVSLSPETRSISTVKVSPSQDINKQLDIPIDGSIKEKGNININNLSTLFLKADFPFGQKVNGLTFLDLIRLALFSRTISAGSTYSRELTGGLSMAQKNTIISLTFTDSTIYEENQSIEVVNSTKVNGLGARFAAFISNIGGNPILVSNSENEESRSQIIYYGKESYTVKKLSSYFNLIKQARKPSDRGISDVIIILGNDLAKSNKF